MWTCMDSAIIEIYGEQSSGDLEIVKKNKTEHKDAKKERMKLE